MFSINNFYDYLTAKYSWPEKSKNLIYKFDHQGSRNLSDLHPTISKELYINQIETPEDIVRYYGAIFLFDDEPIDFTYYTPRQHHGLSKSEAILSDLSRMHTPIICHSEKNSYEVKFFQQKGFLDVHYWYHGLISRDWFRHWKHYDKINDSYKRFGCYIRDTSGSRTYRNDLLEFISEQTDIFCPLLENNAVIDSSASARIDWCDTGKFHIQIVPETLFNTTKTHLTEKSIRPIVMQQPFILVGPPNSLKYMQSYGFKTFSDFWDESYDSITDNKKRFKAIINLVKQLSSLSNTKFNNLMNNTRNIVEFNQKHFFSETFENLLMSELDTNMKTALEIQDVNFKNDPGGTFFKFYYNQNEITRYANFFNLRT